MFSLLQARSLRGQIEQHRDGPFGGSGPFVGSEYGLVVKEAVASLPQLRASLQVYRAAQHPEAEDLAAEIAALEAVLDAVRLPGAY